MENQLGYSLASRSLEGFLFHRVSRKCLFFKFNMKIVHKKSVLSRVDINKNVIDFLRRYNVVRKPTKQRLA